AYAMKLRITSVMVFVLVMVLGLSFLDKSKAQQVDKRARESANALSTFVNQPPDKQIPASVLQEAQCIIVIPGLVKVSVAVGYKAGKGLAICRHEDTNEWGAPAFYNAKGPSIGISLGGEASDVVILAMNEMAEDALTSGAVTVGGGSATAVAGRTGAQVAAGGASTKAPFYTYARAKGGVFAGVDVGSLSVQFNKEANANAYKKEMTPLQTLLEENDTPPALMVFTDAVKELAPSK
ncbi:MAG: lipid-binding SYLF domain-containing protein, partial [Deltaproteobacteria bacterium]|nr:lipid-binding SYLF domain-containing protein [Deltaproteobacteria bacterium]